MGTQPAAKCATVRELTLSGIAPIDAATHSTRPKASFCFGLTFFLLSSCSTGFAIGN